MFEKHTTACRQLSLGVAYEGCTLWPCVLTVFPVLKGRRIRRYGLRDDQWERIKNLLPDREGYVGGTAADNRLFVEAVLYHYRVGIPWRDLTVRFGDWENVHRCLRQWCESGIIERIFCYMAADHDNEYMMIDNTIAQAHQAIGRSRGVIILYNHETVRIEKISIHSNAFLFLYNRHL